MAFKMKGWSAFTKKGKNTEGPAAEEVKKSKTTSLDWDTGETVKRTVSQFGNVEKEKRTTHDGTYYTKTKTKCNKTKTKSGRTLKGVWRDITGGKKNKQAALETTKAPVDNTKADGS